MSDKELEAADVPPPAPESATALTEAQAQFLAECEEDFKHRYTESDEEFTAVKENSSDAPPILDPWYNKPRRNFGWSDRGGRSNHGGGGGGGGYRQHRQNHGDNRGGNDHRGGGDRYGDNNRRDDRYGGHRQADRYQQRHRPY